MPSINTIFCFEAVLKNIGLSYSMPRITQARQYENYLFIDVRCTILLNLSLLT